MALEEVRALGGRGDWTRSQPACDPVSIAGHSAIHGIPQESRDKPQQRTKRRPWAGEFCKKCERCGRARENRLVLSTDIPRYEKGAGPFLRLRLDDGVAHHEFRGKRRLRRDEAQPILLVATQKPAHGGIAKPALTVVDDEQAITHLWQIVHN